MAHRKSLSVIAVLVLLSGLFIGLTFIAGTAGSASSTDGDGSYVWIGWTRGLIKVSATDGSVAAQITSSEAIRSIAVDSIGQWIWAYGEGTLSVYTFDGEKLFAAPYPDTDEDGEGEDCKHTTLAIDPADQGLWIGAGKLLCRVGTYGYVEKNLPYTVRTVALDPTRSLLWVGTRKSLVCYDQNGTEAGSINIGKHFPVKDIAFDSLSDILWVVSKEKVHAYSSSGTLQVETHQDMKIEFVSIDGEGGAWCASKERLIRLGPSGELLLNIDPFKGKKGGNIKGICRYQSDNSIWVVGKKLLAHVSSQGEVLSVSSPQSGAGGNLKAIDISQDMSPPALEITSPSEGAYLTTANPGFSFEYSDEGGSGLDAGSLSVKANGKAMALTCNFGDSSASCTSNTALPEGSITLSATIKDKAGNARSKEIHFTVDTTAPAAVDTNMVSVTQAQEGQVTVSGSAGSMEAGALVTITDLRTGESWSVTAGSDGSFSISILARSGDSLSIIVTDGAGNKSTAASMCIQAPVIPPDPSTTAPPLDTSVATTMSSATMSSATAFLYTGSNPIQTGVAEETIESKRVAVIRGKVLTKDGSGLSGVTISILDHPEFGVTVSRTDGMFDMAVNGGGYLTVNYWKNGYFSSQRQVNVPWRDYITASDVIMIEPDSQVSTIDLSSGAPIQVAQGSTVTDGDGTRKATLLFNQGTTATMVLSDGSTQPLSTMSVRATEYTVGSSGPDAMPAPLPPTSAYTYCVELSVDEALAVGAQTVEFDNPVIQYVENFIGFPAGTHIPVGYYDRTKGQWLPCDDGTVIKILGIGNGMADLDIDGSNQGADATALASLGITDAERTQLTSLYSTGQSLWRVAISHFCTFDFNSPWGLTDDAAGPEISISNPQIDTPKNRASKTALRHYPVFGHGS